MRKIVFVLCLFFLGVSASVAQNDKDFSSQTEIVKRAADSLRALAVHNMLVEYLKAGVKMDSDKLVKMLPEYV